MHTGLCKDCVKAGKVLPSIEHFQQRYNSPRVYFLFYNYFLRAVMGDNKWKSNLEGNKKLGTNIAEAYTHSLIENNYFAWLFEYKDRASGQDLKTEYDAIEQDDDDEDEWNDLLYMPEELNSIEISVPKDEESEFNLVIKRQDEEKYEEIRGQRKKVQEETQKTARSSDMGHKSEYDKMNEALTSFAEEVTMLGEEDASRKKRKVMRKLKIYTSGRGGSEASNKFIFQMTQQVKIDTDSGKQKQFEKAYKNMLQLIETSNKERLATERYQVDCDALYGAEADV